MYKIAVYIPENVLEHVKQAMFDKGAGQFKNYKHCSWQVLGQGQFYPLEESNPTLGEKGRLETIEEYLVEMVCDDTVIKSVIKALKQAHPYEEPAYTVYRLENIDIDIDIDE
ncbi:MAG: NGG1p interacting factor NIF3 [Rickettsiella sp.]|nr:NGG1p interacting factor NIF3 [Rickettsiella sp.]